MSATPHEVLRRRCAEGLAPEGVHPSAYAQALTLYETWAGEACQATRQTGPEAT